MVQYLTVHQKAFVFLIFLLINDWNESISQHWESWALAGCPPHREENKLGNPLLSINIHRVFVLKTNSCPLEMERVYFNSFPLSASSWGRRKLPPKQSQQDFLSQKVKHGINWSVAGAVICRCRRQETAICPQKLWPMWARDWLGSQSQRDREGRDRKKTPRSPLCPALDSFNSFLSCDLRFGEPQDTHLFLTLLKVVCT